MEKENYVLDTFTNECVKLGDLEVAWACHKIYGHWPFIIAGGTRPEFKPNDYLRYSQRARQEVVLAAFDVEEENSTLMNTYLGYATNPQFFEELDLWKAWGLDESFIEKILTHFINDEVKNRGWQNFEATMDYAQKELTIEEAFQWLEQLSQTPDLTTERRNSISNCIKQHTPDWVAPI